MEQPIQLKPTYNVDRYFTKENFQRIALLREKKFRLRHTGISPYVFNQWKKHGLISVNALDDNRKWVTLSFVEWIWLKVIDDLRKFGCSMEDILSIRENLFKDLLSLGSEDVRKNFGNLVFDILAKNKVLTDQQIEEAKQSLKEKNISLENLMQQESASFNVLEAALLHIILTGTDANLILYLSEYFSTGSKKQERTVLVKERHKRISGIQSFLYYEDFDKTDYAGDIRAFFSVPHICIPLKRYLIDFIIDETTEKEFATLDLLNKEELVLIKEMRKGNVKRIAVYYSKGKVDRIEVTRPLLKAQEAKLAETFLSSEYADIEYTVSKGQIVKFEKTIKIKPNI